MDKLLDKLNISLDDPMSILKFLFGAFVINVIWEIIF